MTHHLIHKQPKICKDDPPSGLQLVVPEQGSMAAHFGLDGEGVFDGSHFRPDVRVVGG